MTDVLPPSPWGALFPTPAELRAATLGWATHTCACGGPLRPITRLEPVGPSGQETDVTLAYGGRPSVHAWVHTDDDFGACPDGLCAPVARRQPLGQQSAAQGAEGPYEARYEVVLRGYGSRAKHQPASERRLLRTLHLAFGAGAEVLRDGRPLEFDPVADDGNEPEFSGCPDAEPAAEVAPYAEAEPLDFGRVVAAATGGAAWPLGSGAERYLARADRG